MDAAIEVSDLDALALHLKCDRSAVQVKDYERFDERIGWQTYLVTVDDFPVGFTNGPLA